MRLPLGMWPRLIGKLADYIPRYSSESRCGTSSGFRVTAEGRLGSLLTSRFLHSEAFYAVAQKKYVFIYDQNGVEVQ